MLRRCHACEINISPLPAFDRAEASRLESDVWMELTCNARAKHARAMGNATSTCVPRHEVQPLLPRASRRILLSLDVAALAPAADASGSYGGHFAALGSAAQVVGACCGAHCCTWLHRCTPHFRWSRVEPASVQC